MENSANVIENAKDLQAQNENNVLADKIKKRSPRKGTENPKTEKTNSVKKDSGITLQQLNAIGITEKIQQSTENKSIFKKEYSNKKDRSKCRDKFINAISLYLLQLAHNKKDSANDYLNKAKEIAKVYYKAEDSFSAYTDYCTENMDANKKEQIKLFIACVNPPKKEKNKK